YTGSLGWFAHTGDFELNIIIRTLLAKDGLAHVQAGAGIVADSVPAEEYTESQNKAQALWAAHEEAAKDALLPR
ncbi:MAG: chorismate-binding protein, partial [Verrucomicrobiota bacterium]